jgi:ArsR family transcriptional regulator
MLEKLTNTTKALSDPTRVRALAALKGRELCVCRLIELLQLAPSTVSRHLAILKQAGLVEGRKEGRWMHYRLPDAPPSDVRKTLDWFFQALEGSAELVADQERLTEIVSTDLEELTRIYRK